jgi:hypothetical protein
LENAKNKAVALLGKEKNLIDRENYIKKYYAKASIALNL